MNKVRNLILAVSALLMAACGGKQTIGDKEFLLSGSVKGGDAPWLILMEIGKNGFTSADTLKTDADGNFSKVIKMEEETLYSLSYKEDYITLCPKVGERVVINGYADDFSGSYTVTGSKESEWLKELNEHNHKVRAMLKTMSDYLKINNIDNVDSVKHEFLLRLRNMHDNEVAYTENYIRTHQGSLTSLIALYRTFEGRPLFDYRNDLTIYKEVLSELEKTQPTNQHTKTLKEFIAEKDRENNERFAEESKK